MDEKAFTQLLESNGIAYRVMRHKPVYTVAESCAERGAKPEEETKNLLLKDGKGFFLLVLPGDRRADFTALAKARGGGRAALATPQEVKEQTCVEVGAVNLFSHPVVFVDERVLALPQLFIHPDDNAVSVCVETKAALSLVKAPVFGKFSK